ncbi:MAG: cupin domain-containing protein [Candidatus Binatia bacterium]
MTADDSIERVRERAALYALGALTAPEAREIATRLADGDLRYRAEVEAFAAVADQLAFAARATTAPAPARARVLDAIARHEAAVLDAGGVRFVRGARLEWQPTAIAGFEIKLLMADPTANRATVLGRMAPGTAYPAHRHAGLEELYLLEGDLLVGGVLMRTGDYCSALTGSVHDGVRTLGGCLFVVTASTADEILS